MSKCVGLANLSQEQAERLVQAAEFLADSGRVASRVQRAAMTEDALRLIGELIGAHPRSKKERSSDFGSRVLKLIELWSTEWRGNVNPETDFYLVLRNPNANSSTHYFSPFFAVESELRNAAFLYELATGIPSSDKYGGWSFGFRGYGYSKSHSMKCHLAYVLFGTESALRESVL